MFNIEEMWYSLDVIAHMLKGHPELGNHDEQAKCT